MGKTLVVSALTQDRRIDRSPVGILAGRSPERRTDPDQRDQLGSAARRQPVRASLRAQVVSDGGASGQMRILSFTGGAGSMYCGSCLRDNALAAELMRRGHDVVLTPVYTPTRTDEKNVSGEHVFFGGISVFLEQHSALFRHTPRLRRPSLGLVVGAAARDQAPDQGRREEPRRHDGLDAQGRAGLPGKGDREAARVVAHRAAVRRHQPPVLAAARPGGTAQARIEAAGRVSPCRATTCFSTRSGNRTASSPWS